MATPVDTEGRELAVKINARLATIRETIGALGDLETTDKSSLVAAVNEIRAALENVSGEDDRINSGITSIAITAEQLVIISGGITYTLNAQIP